MDTLIIVNPHAGGGSAVESLRSCVDTLGPVEIVETAEAGHARRLAAEAAASGVDRVVAAGGDGTLHEVVNGIAPDFRPQLGLLPLGTGNDFARIAGIPDRPSAAAELLARGTSRRIDAVELVVGDGETRYFLNVSAGGFSGEVSGLQSEERKAAWGPLSYLRTALEAVSELASYRVRVRFDPGTDHEVLAELDLVNAVVANGSHAASGLPVAPGARLDDGLLDVVLIENAPMSRLSLLGPKLLVGTHRDDELVVYRRARRVEIEAEPAMEFNADGEMVGTTPLVYRILPGAVELAAPEPEEGDDGRPALRRRGRRR